MVRLIMGVKGSGKTKQLIELINNAAKDEPGNVVCIEANRNMTYDIHYHIRLIDAQEYKLNSYEMLRGFISGLYAGNYDISHVFIDNLCKVVGGQVSNETESFLDWLDAFGEQNGIKFTTTTSPRPPRGCRNICNRKIQPRRKGNALPPFCAPARQKNPRREPAEGQCPSAGFPLVCFRSAARTAAPGRRSPDR